MIYFSYSVAHLSGHREKQEHTRGYFTRVSLARKRSACWTPCLPNVAGKLTETTLSPFLSAAGTSVFPRRAQFLTVPSLVPFPRWRRVSKQLPAPALALVSHLALSASQMCRRPNVLTMPTFMCLSMGPKGISAFL